MFEFENVLLSVRAKPHNAGLKYVTRNTEKASRAPRAITRKIERVISRKWISRKSEDRTSRQRLSQRYTGKVGNTTGCTYETVPYIYPVGPVSTRSSADHHRVDCFGAKGGDRLGYKQCLYTIS